MKVAVTVIGWLAIGTLGGWLAWWAATLTDAVPNASATIALGSILLLAWAVGTVTVWRRAWFTSLAFAMAGVLPLTPEHALPLPALLVAVSAALAVGSWLAGVASWFNERTRSPVHTKAQPASDVWQPVPLQRCLICQEPSSTSICATCATALGTDTARWLGPGRGMDAGTKPTRKRDGQRHDA